MVLWLKTGDADFEDRFKQLLSAKRETAEDVGEAVARIIARVREEGDKALIDLTRTYDGLDLSKAGIKVTSEEIAASRGKVDAEVLAALELAHARILDPVSYTHLTLPTTPYV